MLKSREVVPLNISKQPGQGTSVEQEEPVCYFDSSANSVLNSVLTPLVQDVFTLMLSEANRDNITVLQLTVYGHTNPDDGTKQLVITQFVDLYAAEALAYRRRLFEAFGAWAQTLSLSRRSAILENLVMNIRWNSDATADQP